MTSDVCHVCLFKTSFNKKTKVESRGENSNVTWQKDEMKISFQKYIQMRYFQSKATCLG